MRYRAVKNMIVDILHMCQAAHPRAGIRNPRWQAGVLGLVEGKGDGNLSPWPSNRGDACAGTLPDHAMDHLYNDDGE